MKCEQRLNLVVLISSESPRRGDSNEYPERFYGELTKIILQFSSNGPGQAKMCLMPYANNKGADQTAHPRSLRSLISTFVFLLLR